MPSTPINNFDPTNRRNIRRNLSNQIISYTIPSGSTSGGYGLTFTPATTTFYRSERYNEIVDGLSDELIDDIPEFEPIVVSSNNLNSDLLVGEGSIVSISLYDDGNNARIVDASITWSNLYLNPAVAGASFPEAWRRTIDNIDDFSGGQFNDPNGFVDKDNVFHPDNYDTNERPIKDLFYYRPLKIGTKLYQKNNNGILSDPYEPFWKADSSYSAIKEFDTNTGTNLSSSLYNGQNPAYKDLFARITQDRQTGFLPGNSDGLINNTGLMDKFGNYNGKDFTGGIIQLGNLGEVIDVYKLVGEWGNQNPGQTLRLVSVGNNL